MNEFARKHWDPNAEGLLGGAMIGQRVHRTGIA